jgi:hypothetical protein
VLRDTTSRGLYVRVWPPHTSERRGERTLLQNFCKVRTFEECLFPPRDLKKERIAPSFIYLNNGGCTADSKLGKP